MEKKSIEAFIEKKEDKFVAVASTENKDRMGDVIKADGWDLKNFKKNPILQFAHEYNRAPIGIVKNIRIEGTNLIFEPVFHNITQTAREIKQMFEEGIMRAFSVGFVPKKFINKKGEEIKPQMFGNNIIAEAELLEISAVPVPANAQALILEKKYTNEEDKEICKWINGQLQCKAIDNNEKIEKKNKKESREKNKEEITKTSEEVKNNENEKIKEEKNYEIDSKEIKPYPNEHSCRLRKPEDFKSGSFRSTTRKHDDKEYRVIMGKLKEETTMIEQAYRYSKDIWTELEARKHCTDHDGIKFEPVIKEKKEEIYNCECLDCGYKMKSEKHCTDLKCPKCEGKMRRVERPGSGKEIEKEKSEIEKNKKEQEKIYEDKLKKLEQEVMEIKEGRILSGKNKALVEETITSLKTSISVLQDLLQVSEPVKNGEDKSVKGRREEVQVPLKNNKVVVRALQKIVGEANDTLYKIKTVYK